MAREKDGWIKLYSSVLEKDFSLAEFKVWIGLMLLANGQKSKSPGVVDLSIRDLAERLHISTGAMIEAKKRFIAEGRIEEVKIEGQTKPITGIRIINFKQYQGKKFVSPSEHSPEKIVSPTEQSKALKKKKIVSPTEQSKEKNVSPSEQSSKKNVQYMIQNVSPSEQSVSPSEQSVSPSEQSFDPNVHIISPAPAGVTENTKNNKEYKEYGVVPPPNVENEFRKKVFEGLKSRRNFNTPLNAGEAKAINWMLKQNYSVEQILGCYDDMKKDSFWKEKPLYMMSVQKNIGEFVKKNGQMTGLLPGADYVSSWSKYKGVADNGNESGHNKESGLGGGEKASFPGIA